MAFALQNEGGKFETCGSPNDQEQTWQEAVRANLKFFKRIFHCQSGIDLQGIIILRTLSYGTHAS
jgi:hypothetical protein